MKIEQNIPFRLKSRKFDIESLFTKNRYTNLDLKVVLKIFQNQFTSPGCIYLSKDKSLAVCPKDRIVKETQILSTVKVFSFCHLI